MPHITQEYSGTTHQNQTCTIARACLSAWSGKRSATGKCGLCIVWAWLIKVIEPTCSDMQLIPTTSIVPTGPPQTYLTLSLRNLGFSTTQTNLLTIPSSFLGLSNMIMTTYLSEMLNSRVLATVTLQFWALPLLIALYTFTTQTSQWVYFAVVSFE